MPYIHQIDRSRLNAALTHLCMEIKTSGELAYAVTFLMYRFWQRDPSFDNWARTRGAVDDQVDEMRRRVIAPYEDVKRGENGDVF